MLFDEVTNLIEKHITRRTGEPTSTDLKQEQEELADEYAVQSLNEFRDNALQTNSRPTSFVNAAT